MSPAVVNSYKTSIYMKALGTSIDEVQKKGNTIVFDNLVKKIKDSKRVGRAVLLALDEVINKESGTLNLEETQFYVPNSFVLKGTKMWPDIFLYGPSINPYRKDAIARLEQAKKDGAVLVKWIPSTMDIDPADERLIPFYQKMKELQLPLLSHTGMEQSFLSAKDELCDPKRLILPLEHGVVVIAAHAATSGSKDGQSYFLRLRELFEIDKYKKLLFADISATTQLNRINNLIQIIKDPVFKDRLLFGTDWPLIDAKVLGISLTPYWVYFTPFFHSILTFDQVKEVYHYTNSFDRDVHIKELLGVPQKTFSQVDEVLHVQPMRR